MSQVYREVNENVPGGMMTGEDTKHIYPYEYWDTNSTYETADVNGARYLEYCRRLGFRPKFSGRWKKGNQNEGNFVDCEGYWKLLIDRRMYDTKGRYQSITEPINSSGFDPKMVDPSWTGKEFTITKVADDAGVTRIVERTIQKEMLRSGDIAGVDYSLSMDEAVARYTGNSEESTPGIRMRVVDSKDEENEAINALSKKFDADIDNQINGNQEEGFIYNLGTPSRVLQSTGIPNLPIQLSASRLHEKSTRYGHDFELSDIKGLVKAIQEPIAIFKYGDKNKSQNIIVELQRDGKNFVVGLFIRPAIQGNVIEINSIRNIFPKDNAEWLNWISQNKHLYLNKEKIQTLIDQQRTNLADVEYLDLDSITKIINSFENPINETNFNTSESKGKTRFSIDLGDNITIGGRTLPIVGESRALAAEHYNRALESVLGQQQEIWQDNLHSLDVLQREVAKATGEHIEIINSVLSHWLSNTAFMACILLPYRIYR